MLTKQAPAGHAKHEARQRTGQWKQHLLGLAARFGTEHRRACVRNTRGNMGEHADSKRIVFQLFSVAPNTAAQFANASNGNKQVGSHKSTKGTSSQSKTQVQQQEHIGALLGGRVLRLPHAAANRTATHTIENPDQHKQGCNH